jgi:hypothetical protein
MARPKKTAPKKATTRGRKATPKARTPKLPTHRVVGKRASSAKPLKSPLTKEDMSAHLKSQTADITLLKEKDFTRRPPNNPDVPANIIRMLTEDFNSIKELLDNFSQHLRALDRKRLNGVGIKKLGFIDRAYELALENGEFLPHYLTLERFGTDYQYFKDFRSLTDIVGQIHEQLWNITIQSADIVYTDALEFYSSVREAAKRRVDAAETLYHILSPFFKKMGMRTEEEGAEPTKKKALRDFKGLESGKHNGLLFIENEKPKLTGGKRKIIDESFKDSAEFKDIEQGEITE